MKIGEDVESALINAVDLADQELQACCDAEGRVRGEANELLQVKQSIENFLDNTETYQTGDTQ